jgi:ATP synthase F1 epsilon subunit
MAEGALELEILTPEGVALKETVQSVTAPSVEGEFGVLPGHRPLLAALKTGIVSYSKDGTEVRVAVGRGFVEIYEDRAVLLTDHFIRKEDVDPVRTRLDLKDADAALDRLQCPRRLTTSPGPSAAVAGHEALAGGRVVDLEGAIDDDPASDDHSDVPESERVAGVE